MATSKTATRQPAPPNALSFHQTNSPANSPARSTMTLKDESQNPTSLSAKSSLPENNNSSTGTFSVKNFYKLMKYERLRLITYLLYGHQWPKMEVISPTELAKAGFFYLNEDAVRCAFCRGTLRDWEYGETAMEAHATHFPLCPFVRGEYCGNMPFEIDPDINSERGSFKSPAEAAKKVVTPISNSSCGGPAADPLVVGTPAANAAVNGYNKSDIPSFPKGSNPASRSRSFRHASWKNTAVSAEDLVDAGFFFTGKEDRTRCFHCGGMLFNWAPGEVPLEEHARFFPECHWLVSTRSQTYIEFVQFKAQIIELRQKLDSPPAVKEADIACMRAITYQNFLNMKQSASRVMSRLEKRNNQSAEERSRRRRRSQREGQSEGRISSNSSTSSGSSSECDEAEGDSSAGSIDLHTIDLNHFLQKYLSKFSFLTDCQKLFQYLTSLEIMKPQSPPPALTPESPMAPGKSAVLESTSQAATATAARSSDSFSSGDSFTSNASSSSSSSPSASPITGNVISISIFSLDDGQSVNSLESGFDEQQNNRRNSSSATSSDDENVESVVRVATRSSQKPHSKNALQCIICCDRQIEIVFVPCGHQLACRKCSDKMTSCPVCRLAIESKVRTYFAH